MNIYIYKLITLFFSWHEIVVFISEWGMLQFGIRARVAIPGTGMIIWFWNVFQDGENKARSQDWSIPSSGKWPEFLKWKWSRLGSLGRHLLSYTCNISVLWRWRVSETSRWFVVPSHKCIVNPGEKIKVAWIAN
jgi:hypothetical protein